MPNGINDKDIGGTVQAIWETELYELRYVPILNAVTERFNYAGQSQHRTPLVDVEALASE